MGNREKLLEAATAILGRNGYQATSVDEILEAARVAPSNFYYHFKSKEDLGLEVLESIFERSREKFAPLYVNKGLAAMKKLEATTFFASMLGKTQYYFYNNQGVWPKFGYEGSSWEKGGYINRGFDDVTWTGG